MSNYNDDFYLGVEEIYSDSRSRGDRRNERRERNRGDRLSSVQDDSRRDRKAPNTRGNSFDIENFDYDRNHQRTDTSRNRYDFDALGFEQSRGDKRPREQRSAQRKPKLPRTARRALIIAVFLVVLIGLISGIVAIASAVSGVKEVKNLTASEIAADHVSLSWEKVDQADGYRVMMAKDGGEPAEFQTISDPDTLSVTVTDLEQLTVYDFSVITLSHQKESDPVELADIKTLPAAPEITNIFSSEPGEIHVDWSQNELADGYVVEYKKDGGEYSADMSQTISDNTQCKTDITDLEKEATYQVRVSAFASGDKQLSSAPSEEQSIKVVSQPTEIVPKAKEQKADAALDPDKPMIALTFDDGPAVNNDASDRILDVLEKYNAKATFFMVGYYVSQNPDNVKRKAELKMELGNHTWDHSHYDSAVTPDDIRRASNIVYDTTGQYTTCFRSPGGMTTDAIRSECANENMPLYYWSIDTQDWSSRDAESVYKSVMDNVKDGDIILMHEIYESTADAVEKMVPELIEQGYQLVTCHDLIELKGGSAPEPGTQYVSAFETS